MKEELSKKELLRIIEEINQGNADALLEKQK